MKESARRNVTSYWCPSTHIRVCHYQHRCLLIVILGTPALFPARLPSIGFLSIPEGRSVPFTRTAQNDSKSDNTVYNVHLPTYSLHSILS